MRFLLTFVLLLALRPSMAAASECASDAEKTYSFTSADGEFEFGAVRSANGVELLAELTVRANARISDGKRRGPWRVRESGPIGTDILLSLRSRRLEFVRERELPCSESPFAVYLPYHANPPPVQP
jgi:hypothetical protein